MGLDLLLVVGGGPGGFHAGAISRVFDYALTSSVLNCLDALCSGNTHGRHKWPRLEFFNFRGVDKQFLRL